MQKIIQLDDRFPTGEPTILLAGFHDRTGRLVLEKNAFDEGQSPLYDFLKTVQPEPGFSFILVNALGEYEYYDDNRNADGFPAKPFNVGVPASCGHTDCNKDLNGWISEPETLIHHYKSFEKYGNIFKHHVNKDPSKTLGKIIKAVRNERMKRIELLLKIDNSKDPKLVERITSNVFPAVSMGCHVRWDVCTICGHRAPTRAQYCEHASQNLRKILPDGRKVSVLNPSPKFFDISIVFRPADPTGWMLKKVAEEHSYPSSFLGERIEIQRDREKHALSVDFNNYKYAKVASEIVSGWPKLDNSVIEELKQYPIRVSTSKLAEHGVLLSIGEFVKLACATENVVVDEVTLDKIAALQPAFNLIVAKFPSIETTLYPYIKEAFENEIEYTPNLVNWLQKRADIPEMIRDEIFAPSTLFQTSIGPGARYRAVSPPKTQLLTITDPNTGHSYQTTRGSAQEANKVESKNTILGSSILGTMYAGGLRMALGPRAGLWTLPVGLAAGYGTFKGIRALTPKPYRNPVYMTDQNTPVSGGTIFEKMSSVKVAHRDAYDYIERGAINHKGLINKLFKQGAFEFAQFVNQPLDYQVSFITKNAEIEGDDEFSFSTLDLTKFSTNIHSILWA